MKRLITMLAAERMLICLVVNSRIAFPSRSLQKHVVESELHELENQALVLFFDRMFACC